MLRVGFESLGARPAPKPKFVYYVPTLLPELFFSPACFKSYVVFYCEIEPVFTISFIADL